MTVTLLESSTLAESGRKGVYKVRIIGSDIQGSSGYYPRSVVERDVKTAFPRLTRVFADHPTATESKEMPVRSVRKIAGKIISDPWMEEDGAYAEVQFGREWAEFLEDFHDVVGMSIRASGEKEEQDVDGVSRDVVTEIAASPLNSVDLVTVPGADGAVVEALKESFEAAPEQPTKDSGTPSDVSNADGVIRMDKEISERFEGMEASLKSLSESIGSLVESLKPAPAADEGKTDVAEAARSVYRNKDLSESAQDRAYVQIVEHGISVDDAVATEVKIAEEYKALHESAVVDEAPGRILGLSESKSAIDLGKVF
jgi:hypothetical protein